MGETTALTPEDIEFYRNRGFWRNVADLILQPEEFFSTLKSHPYSREGLMVDGGIDMFVVEGREKQMESAKRGHEIYESIYGPVDFDTYQRALRYKSIKNLLNPAGCTRS